MSEAVECCSECSGYRSHRFGKRLRRQAFRLMHSPGGIPESQEDYLDTVNNGSHCKACISLCYRVSELRKGDIEGE